MEVVIMIFWSSEIRDLGVFDREISFFFNKHTYKVVVLNCWQHSQITQEGFERRWYPGLTPRNSGFTWVVGGVRGSSQQQQDLKVLQVILIAVMVQNHWQRLVFGLGFSWETKVKISCKDALRGLTLQTSKCFANSGS